MVKNSLIDDNSSSANNENSLANEKSLVLFKARQVAIDRIKQCCCAYIHERMKRLKHIRWKSGGILTNNVKVNFCSVLFLFFLLFFKFKANLSKEELRWWSNYNTYIFKFQSSMGENGINLYNHVHPPRSLLVHVCFLLL